MVGFRTKLLKFRSAGLSLVELLVVVGILGILTAIAVTNYAAMQIRAGRAEMNMMTKHVYTSAFAYHANSGTFPSGFAYGQQKTVSGGTDTIAVDNCVGGNSLAVAARNCRKLRYVYQFISMTMSFEIQAYSLHVIDTAGNGFRMGDRAPTNSCRADPGMSLYFVDWWSLSSENEMRPYPGNVLGFPVEGDVLKTCF